MSTAGRTNEALTSGARQTWRICRAALLGLLCALWAPQPAHADAAPPSTGSLGFKLGDNKGRLHPFIDVDTHWVTNPGRLYSGPSDLESTGRVGFDLQFPSDIFEIRSDAFVAYNRYWGIQTVDTTHFSTLAGALAFNGIINKDSNLVLRLYENLVRSTDPGNQSITERLQHWVEQAGVAMDIKPGGGTLLLTAGCGYFYDTYDKNQAWVPVNGFLDNWRLLPELRLTWKFWPKTGVFVEALGQFTFWSQGTAQPLDNVDSRMILASAGIAGAITPKVSMLIKAGYANTLLATGGDNLQTAIGTIDFNFDFSDTGKLTLGAMRSPQPTSFFRYDMMNGVYLRYNQQVAQSTHLALAPAFFFYTYGQALTGSQSERQDTDLVIDLSIRQGLADWLSIALIDRLDWRTSNYTTAIANAGYFFNDIYLRIDFRY